MKTVPGATVFTLLTQQIAAAVVVTLQWDANAEVDIDHYTLKWGFVSNAEDHNIDAGKATTFSVNEPWSVGMEVFFVVTATNTSSLESGPSNEVSYTIPHGQPKPPFNLRIIDVTK